MSGANLRLRRVWRVNHLHVPARAPRTAERAHRIEIPTHPPVSSVLGPNERSAQSKSVLWRHTAGGYVQRMVRKQCVRAPRHRLKASVAGISRTLALAPQLSVQRPSCANASVDTPTITNTALHRITASWEEPPLLFSALGGLRRLFGAPFRPFGDGGNLQPTLARGFCSPLRCVGMGLMDRLGDLADVAGRLAFRLDGMGINLAPIAQWELPLRML